MILTLLALVPVLFSCEDYRDDYLLENTVYIRPDAGAVRNFSVFCPGQEVGIIRSGALSDGGKVLVGASSTNLVKYNIASGTRYVNMPSYIYEISGTEFSFGSDDARKVLYLDWDADRMADLLSESKDDLVMPLSILSSDLSIVEDRNLLLMHPVIPTFSMTSSSVKVSLRQGDKNIRKVSASLRLDYPVGDRDVTFTVSAPEGFLSLTETAVTVRAGETSASFECVVDPSLLYDADGNWLMAGGKVFNAPVTIEACSLSLLKAGQTVCNFYTSAE